MKLLINLMVFCCVLMGVYVPARAQQSEQTFLWRISGNGLKQSSYLFGTMHLKAKKLFDFPDSLYSAIDNTDVFALEINPDSMNSLVTSYATLLLNKKDAYEDEKKKEKKLRDILTPAELKTLRENLPPDSEIDPEELTVKQAYLMKDKLTVQKPRKDDMPTFMDGFLYTIARDKGKMVAGVEHAEDQINLVETMDFSKTDPKKVVSYFNNGSSVQDQMIQLYVNKDLEAIQKISDIIPEQQMELLLTARNKNMLRSMDSIMRQHSLFCAVGALHLPGKNGLIKLLRARGYTVSPVISPTYTNGADYEFKNAGKNWVDVVSQKDGYSIKMPGQPNDVNTGSGTIVMKMYYDLGTSLYYVTNHTNIPDHSAVSTSELIKAVAAKMTAEGKDIEVQDITNGTLNGKEYVFLGKSNIYYRAQILANKTDLYMLMVYSQSAIKNADSFFRSFRLIPKTSSANITKTFDDILFTSSLPDNPPTREVSYTDDSTDKQVMYTIVDPTIGNYYFIVCNQATAGYNYSNDTLFLHNVQSNFDAQHVSYKSEKRKFHNYNSYNIETDSFKGMRIKGKLIFCGNREYNVLVQFSDNEPSLAAADSFLQSIRIQQPHPGAIAQQMPDSRLFSCYVPGPLLRDTTDEDNTDKGPTALRAYKSYDKSTLLTYSLTVKKLNPYYWKKADTVLLKAWLDKSIPNSDSTPVYSYYRMNGMLCAEAVAYKMYSDKIHRLKVIGDGRTRYTLDCTYPTYLKDNKRIDSFYSAFSIQVRDTSSMRSSPEALFSYLHSNDSTTSAMAADAIGDLNFSKDDIPAVLRELATSFPDDAENLSDHYTATQLLAVVKSFPSAITRAQLERLYRDPMTAARAQQFEVLTMLAAQKDSIAAFKTIKELLLTAPPTDGAQYILINSLNQHPAMAKTLYPELLQQCADTTIGYTVCTVACRLIDSNYLSKKDLEGYIPVVINKSRAARQNEATGLNIGTINLLARLATKETMEEVKQYQYVHYNYLRYAAIDLLTDSAQRPDPIAIDSIASDKFYRLRLYNMLNEKNMAGIFPKKYLTQQYFAESYLWQSDEEDLFLNHRFIGVKTALYKGKKQTFYLYKAEYDDGDGTLRLGVAGPFSNDPKVVTIDNDDNACGFSEDKLDMKQLDNQLKVYLIKKKINDSRQE